MPSTKPRAVQNQASAISRRRGAGWVARVPAPAGAAPCFAMARSILASSLSQSLGCSVIRTPWWSDVPSASSTLSPLRCCSFGASVVAALGSSPVGEQLRDILFTDDFPRAENQRPLHRVPELPHVAGPGPVLELLYGVHGKPPPGHPSTGELVNEV